MTSAAAPSSGRAWGDAMSVLLAFQDEAHRPTEADFTAVCRRLWETGAAAKAARESPPDEVRTALTHAAARALAAATGYPLTEAAASGAAAMPWLAPPGELLQLSEPAVLAAVQVLACYADWVLAWRINAASDADRTWVVKCAACADMQDEGLLPIMAWAADRLSHGIKHLRQQQQPPQQQLPQQHQQHHHHDHHHDHRHDDHHHHQQPPPQAPTTQFLLHKALAAAVLKAAHQCLLQQSLAALFEDPGVNPLLLPLLRLSAALVVTNTGLCRYAAAGLAVSCGGGGCSSGSGSSTWEALQAWLKMWAASNSLLGVEPLKVGALVMRAIRDKFWPSPLCVPDGELPAAVQPIAASPDMQLLVVLHAAAAAHHLHTALGGTSPLEVVVSGSSNSGSDGGSSSSGSSVHIQVPSWHELVYEACGLPQEANLRLVLHGMGRGWDPVHLTMLNMVLRSTHSSWSHITPHMASVADMVQAAELLAQRLAAAGGRAPADPRCVVVPELRLPLLLVLLEGMLLNQHSVAGIRTLHCMKQIILQGWCYDAGQERSSDPEQLSSHSAAVDQVAERALQLTRGAAARRAASATPVAADHAGAPADASPASSAASEAAAVSAAAVPTAAGDANVWLPLPVGRWLEASAALKQADHLPARMRPSPATSTLLAPVLQLLAPAVAAAADVQGDNACILSHASPVSVPTPSSADPAAAAGAAIALLEDYAAVATACLIADALDGDGQLGTALVDDAAATCRGLDLAVQGGATAHPSKLTMEPALLVECLWQVCQAAAGDRAPRWLAGRLPHCILPAASLAAAAAAAPGAEVAAAASSGPGRGAVTVVPPRGAQELFWLLLSCLKSAASRAAPVQPAGLTAGTAAPMRAPSQLLLTSMYTLKLLDRLSDASWRAWRRQQTPGSGSSSGGDGGSGRSSGGEDDELPGWLAHQAHRWIVLAGRCLMLSSQAIKALLTDPEHTRSPAGDRVVGDLAGQGLAAVSSGLMNVVTLQYSCVKGVVDAADGVVAKALQLYEAVTGALMAVLDSGSPGTAGAPPSALQHGTPSGTTQRQLVEALRGSGLPVQLLDAVCQLGVQACALLPLPLCCNNPRCGALQLLPGQPPPGGSAGLHRCKACKAAFYCGPECQRAAWREHKAVCKRLAAAPPEVAAALVDAA